MASNDNKDEDPRTEREKMYAGDLYFPFEEGLVNERTHAKKLCFQLNQTCPTDRAKRSEIVQQLIPSAARPQSTGAFVESPFHVDFGINLHVGKNFYANHGCTILDCNHVTIGDNCLLAPHVCISAATHPLEASVRVSELELTAPITIGDDVWIGANATICPGVTLGNRVVVGAGAVVTKSFPDDVVIGGVPAKILKTIDNSSSKGGDAK